LDLAFWAYWDSEENKGVSYQFFKREVFMKQLFNKSFHSFKPIVLLLFIFMLTMPLPSQASYVYTYTGNPFSYHPPYATNLSGSFTVLSALAPSTTLELTPYTVGGMIANYEFTDGHSTWNTGNYVTAISPDLFSSSKFTVTTNSTGEITAWFLNIFSPFGNITTFTPEYMPEDLTVVYDNVNVFNNYNAYNFNAPGTWTKTEQPTVPAPATLLLLGSGLVGLTGFRKKLKK
jgi:hypothetical protein